MQDSISEGKVGVGVGRGKERREKWEGKRGLAKSVSGQGPGTPVYETSPMLAWALNYPLDSESSGIKKRGLPKTQTSPTGKTMSKNL